MGDTTNPQAARIPYLPNELKIRILSFIEDPHFLWTTCRAVSPEFRQFSEEQFVRRHLSNLRLELHVEPPEPRQKKTLRGGHPYTHTRSEFLFELKELAVDDPSQALLQAKIPPLSCWTSDQYHDVRLPREAEDFELLEDLATHTVRGQLYPELDLGMRPNGQRHVCPCRSLRDLVKRGFCLRYVGVEKFLEWNADEQLLVLRWKDFLDHAHSQPCVSR